MKPGRLQNDCTWAPQRGPTTAENVVGGAGAGVMLAGWPGFVVGFASHNDTLTAASFVGIAVGTLALWWAVGAFEEVPAPFSRMKRCMDIREGKRAIPKP